MEAENRFTMTKDLFFEGMALVSKTGYGKLARKGTVALAAAWAVLLVLTLLWRQNLWIAALEGAVMVLAAVWLEAVLPRSRAKRAYRKLEAQSGGDMERITRFYAGELEVLTAGTRRRIPYDRVQTLLRSRNLLVLVCQDKIGILLKLDGFTLGSAEGVQALIRAAQETEKEETDHA